MSNVNTEIEMGVYEIYLNIAIGKWILVDQLGGERKEFNSREDLVKYIGQDLAFIELRE